MSQDTLKADAVINTGTQFYPSNHRYRTRSLHQESSFRRARSRFDYYHNKFDFQSLSWRYPKHRRFRGRPRGQSTLKKKPSRTPSPLCGTEEYTMRKIQETSDLIKKQLMMTPEEIATKTVEAEKHDTLPPPIVVHKTVHYQPLKISKKPAQYNIEEIHQKIIGHITKMSHGRKMNLISASTSGYDIAIQQIQRQKRIELSKALRNVCSGPSAHLEGGNFDYINSIIPDIGIKIEDLPLDVIQQLSKTLNLDLEDLESLNSESATAAKTVKLELLDPEDDEVVVSDPSPSNNLSSDEDNFPMEIKMEALEVDEATRNFAQEITDSSFQEEDSSTIGEDTVSTQNEFRNCSKHSQTEEIGSVRLDESLLPTINNMDSAVEVMLQIDQEISRLTTLRQSVFLNLQNKGIDNDKKSTVKRTSKGQLEKNCADKRVIKKRKLVTPAAGYSKKSEEDQLINNIKFSEPVDFDIAEKVLVINVMPNMVLAGTESGKIYCIHLETLKIGHIFQVCNVPVTAICTAAVSKKLNYFYVGSFENNIRKYSLHKKALLRTITIGGSVQCFEDAWGHLFTGTSEGHLIRYSVKRDFVQFMEKISQNAVLVLKATNEGSRPILLVATRNSPVCVRDAMSGLHLRTMDNVISPTVYTLLLENSLVYCGTTSHDILIFSFNDGTLVHKFKATNNKGIGCMKIVGDLLYASCHNGNIYVYNIKTHLHVGVINGPGGAILSMEVIRNIIIVGTLSFKFRTLLIPDSILSST